jgi:hypothetical protein
MVDYHLIRSTDHKQPAAESEQEEDQAAPEPVAVEAVYNYHEDGKSKTIAIKVSLQLPLQ